MYRGIDAVMAQWEKHPDYPYYKLYSGTDASKASNLLDDTDHESTHDANTTRLYQNICALTPGKYLVQFKKTLTANTGNISAPFEIPYAAFGQQTNAAIGNPAIGRDYIHRDDLQRHIDTAIQKVQHEFEMKEMKRKMDELVANFEKKSKSKEDKLDKFMNSQMGQAVTGVLLQKFMPGTTPAIAGGFNAQAQTPIISDMPPHTELEVEGELTDQQMWEVVIAKLTASEGSQTDAMKLLYQLVHYLEANASNPLTTTVKQAILNHKIEPGE